MQIIYESKKDKHFFFAFELMKLNQNSSAQVIHVLLVHLLIAPVKCDKRLHLKL